MRILKGKMAIKLFKTYPNLKQKPYLGNHFWSRGYFVNTIGLDEAMIRRYVKYQEHYDSKAFSLFGNDAIGWNECKKFNFAKA
jgi:putative transposase